MAQSPLPLVLPVACIRDPLRLQPLRPPSPSSPSSLAVSLPHPRCDDAPSSPSTRRDPPSSLKQVKSFLLRLLFPSRPPRINKSLSPYNTYIHIIARRRRHFLLSNTHFFQPNFFQKLGGWQATSIAFHSLPPNNFIHKALLKPQFETSIPSSPPIIRPFFLPYHMHVLRCVIIASLLSHLMIGLLSPIGARGTQQPAATRNGGQMRARVCLPRRAANNPRARARPPLRRSLIQQSTRQRIWYIRIVQLN